MKNSLLPAFVCLMLLTAHRASAQIDITLSYVAPTCHGYTNGSASVIPNNGVSPFTVQWDNGQNTLKIEGIGAGVYSVTVTDATSQTASGTVTVFEPNPLTVDVAVTNIPCATDPLGGAVNAVILGGTNPYQVVWNDGNTDVSRQNLPAGTYAVTATDVNNCTATDQGTILIPPPMDVVAVAIIPSCGGANNGSATVVATGGTPPYTHTWTPGGYTGSTVTGMAPGQYYVCTFDANHCQKDLWVIIPEITGLDVSLSVLSAECTGVDDGVVSAFVNPPGNYEYHWNLQPFTGVTQLTGLAANTFVSVTVTDPVSGCTGTASTTVSAHNAITVAVTDTDIPCAGQNIGMASANASGGTPDYEYVWLMPPTGPQLSIGPNITGLAPGAYMVSVTDSRGCTAIGVADIGIESGPVAVIGGSNTVTCGAAESVIQFENLSTDAFGTIVSWIWTITTPDDTLTFANISPVEVTLPVGVNGTAQLQVTSANGCIATAIDSFTVPGLPNISLSTGAVAMDCNNAPIPIIVQGGLPGYTYVWSPLTGLILDSIPPNAVANPLVTTTYQLVASDQGCTDTVSVEIVRVVPIELSVEHETIETCDSTVLLLATSNVPNVVWVDSLGTPLGNNPITVVAGATAVYTAIATDTLTGCVDSISVSVTGLPDIILSTVPVLIDCDNAPVHIIVEGGSPNITYVWTPMTGLTLDSIPPNVIADPEETTTYQLVASSGLGCNDTLSVQVVRVTPIELSVDHEIVETCDSTYLLLAHTNVQQVIWINAAGDTLGNPPGNPVTVEAGATEIYTAIATDPYGCVDSLTVSVMGLPELNLTTPAVLLDCDNAPVHILVDGGSPNFTYVWSPMTGLTLDTIPPNAIANPAVTTDYQLIASNGLGCNDTVSVKVIRVIPLDLSVEQTLIETCDSTVLLLANASVPNIIWINAAGDTLGNPPGNPITVEAGATLLYTAIATDEYGCADSLEVSVTGEGTDVDVDPDMPAVGCTGSEIQLGLINNHPADILQYLWSAPPPIVITGGTTDSPTVSGPAGTYNITVTVTNQNNCTETLVIPVQIDEMQSIQQAITADLCFGKIVKFYNNSGFDGIWAFGDGDTSPLDNPTHAYANAGMYEVSFTPSESICIMPWDSMINVQEAALSQPWIVNNYQNCIDNAQIQFNGNSDNPNVTWSWTFTNGDPATSDQQNPVVTFTQEDTITATLVITDINGCNIDSMMEVPVIFINDHIEQALSFCIDTTVQLNADGVDPTAEYVWTSVPDDPTLVSTDKNPVVSPEVETIYSVTITQGTFCTVSYQVKVTPLEGANVQLPKDTVLCNDKPFEITATGTGLSYEWSESPAFNPVFATGQTITVTPVKNGVYYVRTANIFGCAALDSIKVNNGAVLVQPEPYDDDICAGEETQLFVTNLLPNDPVSFQWSPSLPNVFNPMVSPDQETTYHVTITNTDSKCADTLDFHVNVTTVLVNAEVTGKDTICPGMSTTLLATPAGNGIIQSYLWSPSGGLSNDHIPDPVAAPEIDQTYTVTVTTENGCTATDDVTIYYISGQCIEPYIFVPKAFTPNNDSYNDFFVVRGVNITEIEFIVWDRWGEKVYETKDPTAPGWDGTFNGKELTPDSYAWYLRARCGNGATYESKGDVTLLK